MSIAGLPQPGVGGSFSTSSPSILSETDYTGGVRALFRDQGGKSGGAGGTKMTQEQADKNRRDELLHRLQEGHSISEDNKRNTTSSSGGKGNGSLKDCVFQQLALEKVMRLEAVRPKLDGGVQQAPSSSSLKQQQQQKGEGGDADEEEGGGEDDPYLTTNKKQKPEVHGGRSGGAMSSKLTHILRKGKVVKTQEKPLEIIIPVTNERMKVADIKKNLKTEYATRYCEHLGVTPTTRNIKFVLDTQPLDKCKIRQVLHPGLGRGERRNHISIQPNYFPPPSEQNKQQQQQQQQDGAGLNSAGGAGGGGSISNQELKMDPVQLLAMAQTTSTKDLTLEQEKKEVEEGAKKAVHDVSLPSFDSYKRKHIYPYNLQERFEMSRATQQQQQLKAMAMTKALPAQQQQHQIASGAAGSSLRVRDKLVSTTPSVSGPHQQGRSPKPHPPPGGLNTTSTTSTSAGANGLKKPANNNGSSSSTTTTTTGNQLSLHDQLMARLSSGAGQNYDNVPGVTLLPTGGNNGQLLEGSAAVNAEQIAQLEHLLDQELDVADDEEDQEGANVAPDPNDDGMTEDERKQRDRAELEDMHTYLRSQLDAVVLRELDTTFAEFDKDDIVSLQQQFLHDFPFEKYYASGGGHGGPTGGSPLTYTLHSKAARSKTQERLKEEADVGRVKSLLSSTFATDMLSHLFNFLFAAYIAPFTKEHTANSRTSSKDSLFVDFYSCLLDFYTGNSRREQLAFDIPVSILMFHVVVEGQLCSKWPQFFKSAAGREVLERVNLFVSAVIDPSGLGAHLSRIESTPQALRALHKKRLPKQLSVTKMTPLMQFIVGQSAVSSEAKLLIRDRQRVLKKPPELLEIEAQLSPLVKPRLLDELTMRKLLAS